MYVLAYAASEPNKDFSVVYPYGHENPCRRLRSTPKNRVEQIAEWPYMRHNWNHFTYET